MIALAHLLNREGIKAVATADRTGLGGPGFLAGVEKLISPDAAAKKRFDLLISMDCGTFDRLPEAIQPLAAKLPIINIAPAPNQISCLENKIRPALFSAGVSELYNTTRPKHPMKKTNPSNPQLKFSISLLSNIKFFPERHSPDPSNMV